jgi:prepilin-type processing-associated H-X9-DG protein
MESTPQPDQAPKHRRPPLRPWVQAGVFALILLVFGTLALSIIARTRAEAAKMTCKHNLKQIALALHNYADSNNSAFPPATIPNAEQPYERRLSWMFEMDPYIHSRMDPKWVPKRGAPWDAAENLALARERLPWFVCPAGSPEADPNGLGLTHYVASLGVGPDAGNLPLDHPRAGAFHLDLNRPIVNTTDYIPNTILVFETAHDLGPWAAGGHPTARPFLPDRSKPFARDGQFGGLHRGGANVAFADGRVIFVSDRVDSRVLRAYVTAIAADIPHGLLE